VPPKPMPVTIKVNGTNLSLVHKFSSGISTATIPDVCKTPSPGGPVPIPYPNIAQSITLSNGTATVKGDKVMAANKGSKFGISNGDNAGVAGGVKSNVFMKEATWILYSFDVKMDGKNAARFTDKMFHNSENTLNAAGVLQNPVVAEAIGQELGDEICTAICEAREKANRGELPSDEFPTLQSYVASKFSSGFPLFAPSKLDVFVEMTWTIAKRVGGAFTGLMSATGRLLSNGLTAPGSLLAGLAAGRAMPGGTFRPDFTVLKNATKPASFDNVKSFVEVKFKGDSSTKNQQLAKKRLGKKNRDKWQEINESDCACS
jgi:hypothetical protein